MKRNASHKTHHYPVSYTHLDVYKRQNGTITANIPTGGTTPYTYSWSPSGGANITASSLSAGTFTVTVTDAHGCTAIASATLTQPATLTATGNVTGNALCFGNNLSLIHI